MRLLIHLLRPIGFLVYLGARESVARARSVAGWALDAAYGPPQLDRTGPAARPRTVTPMRAAPRPEPRAIVKEVPEAQLPEILQVPPEAPVLPQDLPVGVSDRVKTASIHGPGGVLLGVLWVYTYPNQGTAKRLFKVLDRGLARALGRDRYFFPDVPFEPKRGVDAIMSGLRGEVAKLLDQRKPIRKERPAKAQPAMAVNPVAEPPAQAVPAPARTAPDPVRSIVAPTHRRQVMGEVFAGRVTLAGLTNKQGKDGPYKTFCLTIHDGAKEIPLFGAELERQAVDLKIQAGDKVRVVFMGKQPVEIPGKPTSFKNLYQVTRETDS